MKERKLYSITKKLYLKKVRELFPLWFDRCFNPTPPLERFDQSLDEIKHVLDEKKNWHTEVLKRGGKRKKVTTKDALYVLQHLLLKWPGGILPYNAWYAIGNAKDMRLLDKNYRPAKNCRFVDEESQRMDELMSVGGPKAVAAYKSVFK